MPAVSSGNGKGNDEPQDYGLGPGQAVAVTEDEIYSAADAIQAAMERKPAGTMWTRSDVARAAHVDRYQATEVLRWMDRQGYAHTNGRGGAWTNYALGRGNRSAADVAGAIREAGTK
jgi:hypothetical protein